MSTATRMLRNIQSGGPMIYHAGVIWFRSSDNQLDYCYPANRDLSWATIGTAVGCLSAPCAGLDQEFFYFQGDISGEGVTSKLIKMSVKIGGWYLYAAISSTNCIAPPVMGGDGRLYFLTDRNKLMHLLPSGPPAAATDYEGIECATTPALSPMGHGQSLFYSEPDGTVRTIGLFKPGRTPGSANEVCEEKTTQPLLACVDGYLYFEADKTLHRYALDNSGAHHSVPLNHHVQGGVKAFTNTFDKRVYYLADDGCLYGLTVDPWPSQGPTTALCDTKMSSVPCPGDAGILYCRGADYGLYQIPTS